MIIKELYTTRPDGVKLYHTYSDRNMMIQKDGTEEIYSEAIDVESALCTYTETDIPVEAEATTETEQKAEAYDYLTGRGDRNE